MKTNVIIFKSVAVVIAFIVLVSLLGGWGAISSTVVDFIKFIIFLVILGVIGLFFVKTWKKF